MDSKNDQEIKINNFLAKLKSNLMHSNIDQDGGWPDISNEELSSMNSLFLEASRIKWGTDLDGDLPVKCILVDRKKEYMPCDVKLRHEQEEEDAQEKESRELSNLMMLNSAISICTDQAKSLGLSLFELLDSRSRDAVAKEVYVVRYSKNEDWIKNGPANDSPSSVHESLEAAEVFAAEGLIKYRIDKYKAAPAAGSSKGGGYSEFFDELKLNSEKIIPYIGSFHKIGQMTLVNNMIKYDDSVNIRKISP